MELQRQAATGAKKAGRPSRTAQFVALGRAMADAGLSHVPGFRDPTARVFLARKRQQSLARTEAAFRSGKRAVGLDAARTMADLMALRTSVIDAAVRDALAAGAAQLVILGAGYDGRAWRMPELAGVNVIEVDHPATQAEKRRLLDALPRPAGAVAFAATDFVHDPLDAVLARAGHDHATPTCWIWEGVVMYLSRPVMRATLAAIAGRSARGSTLVVNYHAELRGLIGRLVFRLIGEPQVSAWTPAEMVADLGAVGFTVRDDSGMADWNARFAVGKANVERGFYMRLAAARRIGSGLTR